MLMSGVYSLKSHKKITSGEHQGKHKVKSTFRGNYALFIGRDWPNNWFEFTDTFSSRVIVVRDVDYKPHYRPFTLGEARVRSDYSLVNQFRIVRASVKALGDSNKRAWSKNTPNTFEDLANNWYKSKPHERMI